jgi:hypothetical protein
VLSPAAKLPLYVGSALNPCDALCCCYDTGWVYFSTPEEILSAADAVAKVPCEMPTENHMVTLGNGSVFAVFRSENANYPLCSTVSNDEYVHTYDHSFIVCTRGTTHVD